jgi:hypothetical protein
MPRLSPDTFANLAEQRGEPAEAREHWRRAYAVLKGIRDRGLRGTPEDLGFPGQSEARLHLLEDPAGAAPEGNSAKHEAGQVSSPDASRHSTPP